MIERLGVDNNMIKIAICDRQNAMISQLENLIFKICQYENISVEIDGFYSGESLLKGISTGAQYDLLYMDIQMIGTNGLLVAKDIRKMDENVLIIFVSGCEQYNLDLFRIDIFAFIKKPINSKDFVEIFFEANKKICNRVFYFVYRYKNNEYKIPCKEILFFESIGRKIRINLYNGDSELFYAKLSDIELQLAKGKNPFLRIHQSFLVNYHMIRSRSKAKVALVNGMTLQISEDRQKNFSIEYDRLLEMR
jgi:DNA-binding LytR/AlgR family response regulator